MTRMMVIVMMVAWMIRMMVIRVLRVLSTQTRDTAKQGLEAATENGAFKSRADIRSVGRAVCAKRLCDPDPVRI